MKPIQQFRLTNLEHELLTVSGLQQNRTRMQCMLVGSRGTWKGCSRSALA